LLTERSGPDCRCDFENPTLLDHAILLIRGHKAAVHHVPVIDRLQMLDI
jgi:hypothetical protein